MSSSYFFALACERIFINTYSIQNRCYRMEKNSLQARPWSFQPGNVTGWGSEGVNMKARTMPPRATKKNEVTKQVNMVLNVHRNRKAY